MIFLCAHEFRVFLECLSVFALSFEDLDYSVLNKTNDPELLETPCIVHVLVLGLNPLDELFTFATT
jgi:hypothetical protein